MDEMQSDKKSLLKTALIASASVVTVGVIGAVILCFCFPYLGFKATSALGLKSRALFFAEMYERGGNIDGLIYCIQLSDEFMTENSDPSEKLLYADKLETYTEKFFDYPSCNEMIESVDRYYAENAPIEARVSLYSYYEYLVSRNYAARAVTGYADKMIFRGTATKLSEIFASSPSTFELAVVYSALSRADLSQILHDGEQFTLAYFMLRDSLIDYCSSLEEVGDTLETLFLMRKQLGLLSAMDKFFDKVGEDEVWNAQISNLTYHNEQLTKAYYNLLSQYITGKQE